MLSRPRYWKLVFLSAALLTLPNLANGQIIWTDDDFLAADYTTSGAGNQDVKFNVDYSNIDIFGDGFLTVSIPPAPNGGGTGAFVSANNSTLNTTALSFASISPTLANVNVGTGTPNPNYKMRVDMFHSTGTGFDGGAQTGTTNYAFVGVNQTNTTVQMQALNDPGGGLAGQGIRLAITGDAGGAEDYVPVVGGALYRDRVGLATVAGRTYDADDGVDSGLASQELNKYWLTQGFELVNTDANIANDLNIFRGDSLFFSPDPTNPGGFIGDGTGVQRQYWFEEFGKTPGNPDHLTGGTGLIGTPNPNSVMQGGVPYNRWATHEVYWVDGTFTYVIDGVPVQQFTPTAGNTPNLANLSTAGTAVLGLWDLFGGSIAVSPEGANFAIFDNLVFEVATSAPSLNDYLIAEGYLPGAAGVPGDFDGDDDVDGRDFLLWQRGESTTGPLDAGDLDDWQTNYPTPGPLVAAVAVPEPASLAIAATLAGVCLFGNRRR